MYASKPAVPITSPEQVQPLSHDYIRRSNYPTTSRSESTETLKSQTSVSLSQMSLLSASAIQQLQAIGQQMQLNRHPAVQVNQISMLRALARRQPQPLGQQKQPNKPPPTFPVRFPQSPLIVFRPWTERSSSNFNVRSAHQTSRRSNDQSASYEYRVLGSLNPTESIKLPDVNCLRPTFTLSTQLTSNAWRT